MRKETGRCEGNQKIETRCSPAFDLCEKKPNHKKSPMMVTKPKIISKLCISALIQVKTVAFSIFVDTNVDCRRV